MRKSGLRATIAIIFIAMAGMALAQTTEGPLAVPNGASHVAKPAKKVKHNRIAHREIEDPPAKGSSPRRDLASPSRGAAADPLSFGMRWNGNSDNARETRVQNYNGGAGGSGAEVGMRLHF